MQGTTFNTLHKITSMKNRVTSENPRPLPKGLACEYETFERAQSNQSALTMGETAVVLSCSLLQAFFNV